MSSYKNSAGVKFNDATELIIRADPDGTVESCFNLSNNTEYVNGGSDTYDWIGENAQEIYDSGVKTYLLKDTLFDSWTPTTTATKMIDAATLTTITADFTQYDYVGILEFNADLKYNVAAANAQMTRFIQYWPSYAGTFPFSAADFEGDTESSSLIGVINPTSTYLFYLNTSLELTSANNSYNGIYAVQQNNNYLTIAGNTITVTQPEIQMRASSTYWSTTQCGNVDKDNSKVFIRVRVYRVAKGSDDYHAMKQAAKDIYQNGIV